jgi:pimeloyl-ACP methyl ester carboxylesterase
MLRKLLFRLVLPLFAVYVAVCVGFGIKMAELSLHLPKHGSGDGAGFRARVGRQFHARVQDVAMTAADGAVLRGWFVQPPHPNGEAVVLLHGITGNRIDPSGYGDIFLQHGYSILLPDSREHGQSGGPIATYGILERDDVRRWVSLVRQRAPRCTYLLGESMGAAIALQAAAVTSQVCAIAVEDPYANFREISYERLANATATSPLFWRTVGAPMVEAAIAYTWLRYRIYLPDAAPAEAVQQSHVPTLLIAGTNDHDIPMHHAQELAASCADHCALWIVSGAGHGGAAVVAPVTFEYSVLSFFQKHD